MSRRPPWALIGATTAVLVVGVGAGALALRGDDPSHLAGADLLGGGGDQALRPLAARGDREDVTLEDVQLDGATLLATDTDGSLLLMVEGVDSAVVRASADGRVTAVGFAAPLPGLATGSSDATADLALGPEGRVAMALVGGDVLLLDFGWNTIQDFDARFAPGAVALAEDETILVGSAEDGHIDAVAVDNTVRHLLGPPDAATAAARWEEPLGAILALQPLPDGRLAFVAGTPDGPRLHLLDIDDGQARPIAPDHPDLVRGAEPDRPRRGERTHRLPIEPLAVTSDGQLLTTGLGPEGSPRISLVDIDSGEVEVLAELDGIEPTIERPVSVTAVDDDLLFLADGRIWKLEGALGS
jgi:hypothetical protein